MTDVLDALAGIAPGSPVDTLRRHRTATRANAQASYDALFSPPYETGVTAVERLAVATFVAGLHRATGAHSHYRGLLVQESGEPLASVVDGLAADGAVEGPYGAFPATADLRQEDRPGLDFRVPADVADGLGRRLSSALEHSHLLVFRPREAGPDALGALLAAGWSPAEVVTLSQLVAFLSFQVRVAHGLAVLEESLS